MTETTPIKPTNIQRVPGTKVRNLTVRLTDAEISEYRRQAIEVYSAAGSLRKKKTIQNQAINVELKELDAEAESLRRRAKDEVEEREIECYDEKDLDKQVLYTKRADTDEVVDSRKLKVHEMQADLPMEDPESMKPGRVPASPALGGASKPKGPKLANVPPPTPMAGKGSRLDD